MKGKTMKPSIGRIIHFYNTSLANQGDYNGVNLNGTGAGPYPAMVIQDFTSGPYVNLIVHAYGGDWREGSVSEKSETNASRYWEWPPKV
jgi:hypothetical protein